MDYSTLSADDLRRLEADRSQPDAVWQAVVAELARRGRTNPPAATAGAPPPASPPLTDAIGDARIAAAAAHLRSLLVPGETIECLAVQRRIFALVHRRVLVAATTGRFITIARKLLGGFDPVDVRWQDVKDVHIAVGALGATISIHAFAAPDLAINGMSGSYAVQGLDRAAAESVYRCCQAQVQAWREKRRIRELEELRAKSGGINLAAGGGAPLVGPNAAGGTVASPVDRLNAAKQMLDGRLITDSEYESLRARIIADM